METSGDAQQQQEGVPLAQELVRWLRWLHGVPDAQHPSRPEAVILQQKPSMTWQENQEKEGIGRVRRGRGGRGRGVAAMEGGGGEERRQREEEDRGEEEDT